MVTTEKEPWGPEGSYGMWQNIHWDHMKKRVRVLRANEH